MRNLFLFLYRYHAFFLFLFLQVVCLYLIIANNSYQRAAFYNMSDEVVGRTMSLYKEVTGYLILGESNKQLARENAELRNRFPSMYYVDTSKVYAMRDSSRKIFYTYVPARVIQITTDEVNNYIMINKGSDQGIQRTTGVVGPDGVVGVVVFVSPHFALLNSLLHSQATVSARVRRDGGRGIIRWDGKSADYVNLNDVTRQDQLHKGDTIFTSGASRIFPDNIPIGTIDEFKLKEPGNFYEIRVKLATNYHKIDYVYVVNNMLHEEMDSLLKKTANAQ
jgi:rod shape-determining protein MreC